MADRAGMTEAASVTTMPAAIEMRTVDGVSTTGPDGMDAPNAANIRSRPQPRPSPATTPAADASTPTMSDSSSVPPKT